MKVTLLLFCPFLFFLPYSASSQEYSYTHYDINEGLAGSSVYCIAQDKQGFLWLGTETGVSRFDGTHFKTFTTVDGLPDVEILHLFTDSHGRVWMAPFRKSVCYFYNGKIYNQENDSTLKKIHLKRGIESFAENSDGDILIHEVIALHLLSKNNEVKEYDSINNKPIEDCSAISKGLSGHFQVLEKDNLYELDGNSFRLTRSFKIIDPLPRFMMLTSKWLLSRITRSTIDVKSLATGKLIHLPVQNDIVTYSILGDTLLYQNKARGTIEYNLNTGRTRHLLPDVEVSRTFADDEGNTWFTSIGQGIFRLNSNELKNLNLEIAGHVKCPVYSVIRSGSDLFAGSNNGHIFRVSLPGLHDQHYNLQYSQVRNRVMFLDRLQNGQMVYGMDYTLGTSTRNLTLNRKSMMPVKTGFRINENEALITSRQGCIKINLQTFETVDTLYQGRATAVYFKNDSTYIGTLNGLFLVKKDKSVKNLDDKVPFFKNRISAITQSANGVLWVAAYEDAGVMGYRNGQVITTITSRQGLTSNICRTLLVHHNTLWIGTDKGLNKVELDKPGYPVTRYTSTDGLGSNIINVVYADSSTIYVGTPAGLSFFDETRANTSDGCRLVTIGLINSGKDRIADTANLHLSHTENNLRFEFAGISYKSAGNISYKYRLLGLDSNWKNTRQTYLDYPTLPSGRYELQMLAINNFGIVSAPLSIRFVVNTPFWQTSWFYIIGMFLFLGLTWLFVSFRIAGIRNRQAEKQKLNTKIAELEHMALLAQMNPHFIFNCFNSIQQYIFDQDIFSANTYITGLAGLIRMTLQNSSKTYISLSDEIDYLSAYLSLEKLRFKEKMNYSIEVDPSMKNNGDILIPPMLIQPYVENSMRHGIRHKTDGSGYIRITVMPGRDYWELVVEDNGIGREKAASYKTREHIEYQSRGMSLTADRIRIINAVAGKRISIDVIDLEDQTGNAAGTRVVFHFPTFDQPY